MNKEYNEVPNIISCKDLDYLSDMFNWNYGAYKASLNAGKSVIDKELSDMLDRCSNTFHSIMIEILDILNGGNNE